MNPEIVGGLGIVSLFLMLALRMYIGMGMALLGFLGLCYLVGVHAGTSILGITPMAEGSWYTLSVIPLFVLMGQFAFVSGVSRDIYDTAYAWMGHFRGGLAMATIVACCGFAAVCGSSLATGATMAMVSIPEMDKYQLRSETLDRLRSRRWYAGHTDSSEHWLCHLRYSDGTIDRQTVHGRHSPWNFAWWPVHGYNLSAV